MIALRSYEVAGSGAVFQTSIRVRKPSGVAVGDLLLFSVTLMETIDGYGASVDPSAAPAAFTDLLLDGGGVKKSYAIDPVSAPAWTWWLGWKWADSSDVAASSYLVNIASGSISGSPVGASNTHVVLAALTGFDATTPFGDTGYANDIAGSVPISIPAVTTDEGVALTDKTVSSSSGGLGQRSLWSAITHAADGAEEMIAAGEAINSASLMISANGMSDVFTHHYDGGASFYLGRGFVVETMTVHLRQPEDIGHDR